VLLKVIACEIAFRELCHAAARTPNLVELEFLTQGYHDTPALGRAELQKRIEQVTPGRYEAILIGYGLCSSILTGLRAAQTRLVIPRAHDCITWFLGSKERYQECFTARPGTYYYTSGWLECRQRRGGDSTAGHGGFLPAHSPPAMQATFEAWARKYGEEQARYLLEVMKQWSAHYTHGTLIDYDFTRPLELEEQVRQICAERGWTYERIEGDLRLLQRWLDGEWDEHDFLIVPPGGKVAATFDQTIIGLEKSSGASSAGEV
jgi:hypothetical protein